MTARFGYSGRRVAALGTPLRRNSAYASSTTRTEPWGTAAAASANCLTSASESAVPVGLLGLATITMLGAMSAIAATAASMSRVKSSRRGRVTKSVMVSRAYSGYIEYVGAKLRTLPAGPAEGLVQVQHDLVGAVGRPDVLGLEEVNVAFRREVVGEVDAQRRGSRDPGSD